MEEVIYKLDTALSPDGDFILDKSGLPIKIFDTKEILQKILINLTARIGSFIYDKSLGSELYKLRDLDVNEETLKREATIIIKKAIYNIPQAEFLDASLRYLNKNNLNKKLEFTILLIINNKEETVVVKV